MSTDDNYIGTINMVIVLPKHTTSAVAKWDQGLIKTTKAGSLNLAHEMRILTSNGNKSPSKRKALKVRLKFREHYDSIVKTDQSPAKSFWLYRNIYLMAVFIYIVVSRSCCVYLESPSLILSWNRHGCVRNAAVLSAKSNKEKLKVPWNTTDNEMITLSINYVITWPSLCVLLLEMITLICLFTATASYLDAMTCVWDCTVLSLYYISSGSRCSLSPPSYQLVRLVTVILSWMNDLSNFGNRVRSQWPGLDPLTFVCFPRHYLFSAEFGLSALVWFKLKCLVSAT